MRLSDIRNAYITEGFSYLDASSRTSQDIVLALIAKSPLAERITIKGGVVMQHISGDGRRATQDLDFDFIKYSLSEESIKSFVGKLCEQSDDINITIIAPIEELKHQDYNGKRAHVRITDSDGTSIDTKLDIGIHKDLSMEQDVYCFDLCKLDDSVTLLINTKEQIFVEKLKSLLRLGVFSTRYKDIFDMYWLAIHGDINKAVFLTDINAIIFSDATMREESMGDIVSRLEKVLNNHGFIESLSKSKRHNWLSIDVESVTKTLLEFFKDYWMNYQ